MKDKKGLSQVVTIVILVVLVLIAAGIIWAVVSNLIARGATQIDLNQKCLEVDIKPTIATCDALTCTVTLVRSSTGTEIDGIKISFVTDTDSDVQDYPGDINVLKTITPAAFTLVGISGSDVTKVKVSPYFMTDANEEYICTNNAEYNL